MRRSFYVIVGIVFALVIVAGGGLVAGAFPGADLDPGSRNITTPISISNGGTGTNALTNHGAVVAGASALSTVAPGSANNVLSSNGTDWVSAAVPVASSLASGTAVTPSPVVAVSSASTVALTGTTSANLTDKIVGSGTAFLTEVAVGDLISVAGGPLFPVIGVTDNTHLAILDVAGGAGTGGSQAMARQRGSIYQQDTSSVPRFTVDDGPVFYNSTSQANGTSPSYVGSATLAQFRMMRFNSSFGSPTAIANANQIAAINIGGFDGTLGAHSAQILAVAGSTWTTSAHETTLSFSVTPASSTTVTEAMKIQSTGALTLDASQNKGTCTLNGGTPSTCTATVTASSVCTCTEVGATAIIAAAGCAVGLSGTTLTITGAAAASNNVNYHCF